MKYGFLRDVEYELFDELLLIIKQEFGYVSALEIGVFGGATARGIANRCKEIDCPIYIAGVDVKPGDFEFPTPDYAYYQEDSMDAWRKINGTYNCLFLDGCHCVNHVICDFLNYSPLVEVGGYILLHDTALPDNFTSQAEYPQDHSYAGKPDSILGVREGLKKLGLLDARRSDFEFIRELESSGGLMGMMLYRRVKPY